jgi:hypothetical protein
MKINEILTEAKSAHPQQAAKAIAMKKAGIKPKHMDESAELEEEFDLIESIINRLARHNGVDAEVIWEDLETLTEDELYAFAVTSEPIMESQGMAEGAAGTSIGFATGGVLGSIVGFPIAGSLLGAWLGHWLTKNTTVETPIYQVYVNGKIQTEKLLTGSEAVKVVALAAEREHDRKTEYTIVDNETGKIVFRKYWKETADLNEPSGWVDTQYESQEIVEDWQKANKRDRTDGMSQKAVNAYRRENPGSKLKTAVTTKPSKLKKGGKASKRRKSYCSRSRGQMKMHSISCAKTPDKAICKARRRWNC